MENTQARGIAARPETVAALLDRLATPDDVLWPSPPWPRLHLDHGLAPGSAGGHGPIRYRVTAYEPGHRIRLEFDPTIGLTGHHEFTVEPDGVAGCRLVHTLRGHLTGRMILTWPLAVRWLHQALLQDLLDNAELAATGGLAGPRARHSPWVRLLTAVLRRRRPSAR